MRVKVKQMLPPGNTAKYEFPKAATLAFINNLLREKKLGKLL